MAATITIACRTSTPEGFDEFEYAVLVVTEADLLQIMERIGLGVICKKCSNLFYRIAFFESHAHYVKDLNFDSLDLEDADHDALVDFIDCQEGWAIMPEGWELAEGVKEGITAVDTAEYDEGSVLYKAIPDNMDGGLEVETQVLTKAFIVELLTRLRQPGLPPLPKKRERVISLKK